MTALIRLTQRLIRAEGPAFRRALALSVMVLAMGAALLGLSGWFVTAAAAAGLAGIGIGFDFFRPSAGVRFLALGRAGARYGERMLTHGATLRALDALRGALWAGITRLPHEAQARLRGGEALNRLTADIDALDGLMARLVLPFVAAVLTHLGAALALALLVTPEVALAVGLVYLLTGATVLALVARSAHRPATEAEAALQGLRAASLDLMRNRADLAVAGALLRQEAVALGCAAADEAARNRLDRIDRLAGLAITAGAALAATLALALGGRAAEAGTIAPAQVAIGFFVALALAETLGVLRRGMADLGRMQGAAARVLALTEAPDRPSPLAAPLPAAPTSALPTPALPATPREPLLRAEGLRHRREGALRDTFGPLSFSLAPGETLLVTGPSGAGKSTLIATLAGLVPASGGAVWLAGRPLSHWPEDGLRRRLCAVPQRSALMAGTLAEALMLAWPGEDATGAETEAALWAALDAVQLGDVARARAGLATRLGPGGAGLSGGQAKRLALARAALRRPEVLLLDEPSEGLDAPTAAATLAGLRGLLPQAGFVLVSHRAPDAALAASRLHLEIPDHS